MILFLIAFSSLTKFLFKMINKLYLAFWLPIYVTGIIEVGNAEITVLDSDLGSAETQKKYVVYFGLISYL